MMIAAMTQDARPARLPGGMRGNGPANNDSSFAAAQADPAFSLAGAYLNQFNEMIRLIERLPGAPGLIGDLLNWQPTSYQDFFIASAMPGRASATDVYASLNRCVRQNFETLSTISNARRLAPWPRLDATTRPMGTPAQTS
ncbi:MAG TPA: hypothetical protein VIF02_03950 [Methylocella sp.]